jgi:hypothetical protein
VFAAMILEMNPLKGRNAPLWILWGEWDHAIRDAIGSNDVSLLLHTLGGIKDKEELRGRLADLLKKNPVALQLWLRRDTGEAEVIGSDLARESCSHLRDPSARCSLPTFAKSCSQ